MDQSSLVFLLIILERLILIQCKGSAKVKSVGVKGERERDEMKGKGDEYYEWREEGGVEG